MKKRSLGILIILVVLAASVFTGYKSLTKLTYLEFEIQNEQQDGYISMAATGDEIIQDFRSPYNILRGVSIKIGTYSGDNNSLWNIAIKDPEAGRIIFSRDYNASLIEDNSFHYFDFFKNVRIDPEKTYQLCITAKNVNDATKLAFYRLSIGGTETLSLYHNSEKDSGMLSFSIYGGNTDYWWLGYTIIISLLLLVTVLRFIKTGFKGLKDDKILMSLLTMWIVIILLSSFSVSGGFTDENDNMMGGMIIANGGVLYRDYVVQHTPVAYYLCAVFAMLGAGSVAQFRLSYYVFEAIIWALLYFRHSKYFGKYKMLLLPIAESIFIFSVIPYEGIQILSDGLQGVCMVALLLEFMRYYTDRKLSWDRCIVISLSIWGSFGSAFVSAYAIVWIVLVVIGLEIVFWKKEKPANGKLFKSLIARYYKLIIAIIVPLICAILYFKLNHSVRRALDQFYTFNREVYPEYTGGLGRNIAQPFINAIQSFFGIIANNFNSIIVAQASNIVILQLVIAVLATVEIIILALKKRFIEAFVLFMGMCCSATRGYGFHGLAAWYVAIMIVVILNDTFRETLTNKVSIPVFGIIAIILMSTYVGIVGNNLLYKQPSISRLESEVIARTDEGDGILYDAYCNETLYFMYKNRYPVNRAVYMLPWYMDWYEQDNIYDLMTKQPKIVVYAENISTWGHTNYMRALLGKLQAGYTRLSDNPDDGWKYKLWVKNTSE